jgi:hypothetical protein
MIIEIDTDARILRIGDVKYSLALFEGLSFAPVGTVLEIIRRSDGVVAVKRLHEREAQPCRKEEHRKMEPHTTADCEVNR